MTDLSQAIVNGFSIAAKMRDQRLQEQDMWLTDQYRKDTLAESTRRFGLEHGLATKKHDEAVRQFDLTLKQQEEELKSTDRYRTNSLALQGRQEDRLSQAQQFEQRRTLQAEEDAFLGNLAAWQADLTDSGAPPTPEQIAQAYANNPIGRRLMAQAGVPTNSVVDDHPFDQVASGPGRKDVLIYGRRPDGSVAIPDTKRSKDNSGGPVTILKDNIVTLHTAALAASPAAREVARQRAIVKGLATEADGAEQAVDQVIGQMNQASMDKYATELDAWAQGLQKKGAAAPGDPAATGRAFLRQKYGLDAPPPAGANRLDDVTLTDRVGSWWQDSRARTAAATPAPAGAEMNQQGDPLVPIIRAYEEEKAKGAAADPARLEALGARINSEASAAAPAPAAPAAPPEPRGLDANDPRLVAAVRDAQAKRGLADNARVVSLAQRGGLDLNALGAMQATGGATTNPSTASALIKQEGDLRAAAIKREEEHAAAVAAGTKTLADLNARMMAGDKFDKQLVGEMNQISVLANQITGGELGANSTLAPAFSSALASVVKMGDGIEGADNPATRQALLAGVALAATNPTVNANDPEQIAAMSERVMSLYNSARTHYGAEPSPVQIALLADLAASGYSSEEQQAYIDAYMKASPAQADAMLARTLRAR